MEQVIIDYIKNMFEMASAPEWEASHEGVIFYDTTAHKWVIGTDTGWSAIERFGTSTSTVTPINWIDPFEYPTTDIIQDNYITSNSGVLNVYTDSENKTYGDYSLKCVANISGSLGEEFSKNFSSVKYLGDDDEVKFDVKSSREGENIEVEFNDILENEFELVVSSGIIDEPLYDFPLTININDGTGINGYDLSGIFEDIVVEGDDFDGIDGDVINQNLWNCSATFGNEFLPTIKNNKWYSYLYGSGDGATNSSTKYRLSGSFDIQCDFNILSETAPSSSQSYSAYFQLNLPDSSSIRVSKAINSSGSTNYTFHSTTGNLASWPTSDTSGKVRFVRSGIEIRAYFWHNSRWEWNGSTSGGVSALSSGEDLIFSIYSHADFDGACEIEVDNFKINSGTVVWPTSTIIGNGWENLQIESNSYRTDVDDDFLGDDGDLPDSELWASTNAVIKEDMVYTGVLSGASSKIQSMFSFEGDFDIQFDYDIKQFTQPTVADWPQGISIRVLSSDAVSDFSVSVYSYTTYANRWQLDGPSGGQGVYDTVILTGKIRCVRVGETITSYLWYNDRWEWDGDVSGQDYSGISTSDVSIRILAYAGPSATVETYFDNFKVNSGKVVWGDNLPTPTIAQCPIEVESWDAVNKKATIHTKIPYISNIEDTVIKLTSGVEGTMVGLTGSTEAQAVWDSNFVAVYTMAQDPSTGGACILDSTSNVNHGTPSGSMTSDDLVDGDFGKALDFDGVDDCITLEDIAVFKTASATIEVFFNVGAWASGSGNQFLLSKQDLDGSGRSVALSLENTGDLRLWADDGSSNHFVYTSPKILTNAHHYCAGVLGSTGIELYLDGGSEETNASYTDGTSVVPSSYEIGSLPYDRALGTSGLINEVRISNNTRSAVWIKSTNNSIKNQLFTVSVSSLTHSINIKEKDIFQKEIVTIPDTFEFISNVIFRITNADLENTFYVDNMYAGDRVEYKEWVDPFEYTSDENIRDNYIKSHYNLIQTNIDSNFKTFGDSSLMLTTYSGSLDQGVIKTFDTPFNSTDNSELKFDVMSNSAGRNLQIELNSELPITELETLLTINCMIDSSNVDEDLVNFPVMVVIEDYHFFDAVGDNYLQFRIEAVTPGESVTECYAEIEMWEAVNNKAVIHVRLPNIYSDKNTLFNIYAINLDNFDYIGVTGSVAARNVWDANFVAVYHMAQDPSTGGACILDSTSNAAHGTPYGSMTSDDLVDGDFGKALEFDGVDDYFLGPQTINNTMCSSEFSFEFFAKKLSTTHRIFHSDDRASDIAGNTDRIVLSTLQYTINDQETYSTNPILWLDNTNYHYGVFRRTSSTAADIYEDGIFSQNVANVEATTVSTLQPIFMAIRNPEVMQFSDWQAGEIRISSIARSAAWIKATNLSNTNALFTTAAVVAAAASSNQILCTISSALVDSDLTDFPVMVNLSEASGTSALDLSALFTELSDQKLKFKIEADGVECPVEIEHWDFVNKKAILWVKVPFISATVDTVLTLTYDAALADNTTYVGETGSTAAQSVWDSNFAAVYHMAQDPSDTGACILDSTANANHGTPNGSMTSGDLVDGDFGKALELDGVDDGVSIGDITDVDGKTALTIEARCLRSSDMNDCAILRKWASGDQSFSLGTSDNTALEGYNDYRFFVNDDSQVNRLVVNSTNGSFLQGVVKGVTGVWYGGDIVKIFEEGIELTLNYQFQATPTNIANTSELLAIGYRDNAGVPDIHFNGEISEIRLSSVARPEAWIKATNLSNTDAFIEFKRIGAVNITKEINIQENNKFQTESVGVTLTDLISNIIFRVINDDSERIFYIDNMYLK